MPRKPTAPAAETAPTAASAPASDAADSRPPDFLRALVAQDVATQKYGRPVMTRFPPEPNGYLHLGHAKAICIDFGLAEEFGGVCNLRFDDTNPETEDMEFVEAIQRDLKWLGFDPGDRVYFASDYYGRFYEIAVKLVQAGKAYVDSVDEEELRRLRGTVTEPGQPSPYRDRSVAENLDLLARMKAGEFPDGAHVLRAKIGLSSSNMKMRDPLLYRIRHKHHFRTGDEWCIYPMYDFAHCLSDAIEGITHSLCTLEFDNNRELYDWLLKEAGFERPPEQTEFAKLGFTYILLSKRNLKAMVQERVVSGWDDPRMPTLSGMRRRGIPAAALRKLVDDLGVAKSNATAEYSRFEGTIRDVLNPEVPRVMAVLRPLKVTLLGWPDGEIEWMDAPLYPHDVPKEGTRKLPFSGSLYIEREDFEEDPPDGFRRLVPGGEVRLRYGYFIRCEEVVRDPKTRQVIELKCSFDPSTRGGSNPADGRKVKGTIHWVSADAAVDAQVRLYDRLFTVENPGQDRDWREELNPASVSRLYHCKVEPSIAKDPPGSRYQFERQGYFVSDSEDSRPDRLVYNRIVPLKDSWDRKQREEAAPAPVPAPAPAPAAAPVQDPGSGLSPEEQARVEAFAKKAGIGADDARILVQDEALAAFFAAAVQESGDPGATANWVVNDLRAATKDRPLASLPLTPVALGRLVKLVAANSISSRIGRDVFAVLLDEGGDPKAIVDARGWSQLSDEAALKATIATVLAGAPEELAAYRDGKKQLKGFFVGQVMKATEGRANPQLLQRLLGAALDGAA